MKKIIRYTVVSALSVLLFCWLAQLPVDQNLDDAIAEHMVASSESTAQNGEKQKTEAKKEDTKKETAKKDNTAKASEKKNTATKSGSGNGSAQTAQKSYQEQILDLCNEERAKAGVAPLQLRSDLNKGAAIRATETIQLFEHKRPDGNSFSTVLPQVGVTSYSIVGENILMGTQSAKTAMSLWMNSEGHRANILNPRFKYLGVGKDGVYWSQLFLG